MDSFKKMFILSAVVLFTTFKLGLAPRMNFYPFSSKFKLNNTKNEESVEKKQQENKRKIYFIRQFFIFSRQAKMCETSTSTVTTDVQADDLIAIRKCSAFTHMYQFSMELCLKSLQELKSWLYTFIYYYSSLIINASIYNRIEATLFNWYLILSLSILGLEIIVCVNLIEGILHPPGIKFMFGLIAFVCGISIWVIAIGNISASSNTIHKDKSKEI